MDVKKRITKTSKTCKKETLETCTTHIRQNKSNIAGRGWMDGYVDGEFIYFILVFVISKCDGRFDGRVFFLWN